MFVGKQASALMRGCTVPAGSAEHGASEEGQRVTDQQPDPTRSVDRFLTWFLRICIRISFIAKNTQHGTGSRTAPGLRPPAASTASAPICVCGDFNEETFV